MLFYFLVSIVNSSVQGYLLEQDEAAINKLEKEKKKVERVH